MVLSYSDGASIRQRLLSNHPTRASSVMGRKAWILVASELAGQRAAVVMSPVQSARMCGHEPWAYLRKLLQRLPTQINSRIKDLL